jgi:SWI/SNF-related matrix-associated actin-dependent regulator of chromatin subfamily A member 5
MQLRKLCNHPYIFDKVEEEGADPMGDHLIKNSGKLIVMD